MSNAKAQMSNQIQNPNDKNKYNLEERTAKFGENIIEFAQTLSKNTINIILISQMIKSGTSLGANYMEADAAESRKDFRHKIHICRKEIQETKYWLELLGEVVKNEKKEKVRVLWKEAHELTLIFNKISNELK